MDIKPYERHRYRRYRHNMKARRKKPMSMEEWVKHYRGEDQPVQVAPDRYKKDTTPRKRKVNSNAVSKRDKSEAPDDSGTAE